MGQASKELGAEDAINIAFALFEKYVDRAQGLKNVLLDELASVDCRNITHWRAPSR
jgi:hypothetical protein